jgi:hypothetical protein
MNPIERYWGMVKRQYRRQKLASLAAGDAIAHEALIKQCLLGVAQSNIRNICASVEQRHFKL